MKSLEELMAIKQKMQDKVQSATRKTTMFASL